MKNRIAIGIAILVLSLAASVHADVDHQGPTNALLTGATASAPAVRLTPPTTTTIPMGVTGDPSSWKATSIAAGWPESYWPWIQCVILGESGGNQFAINDNYLRGGQDWSFGLMQLNTRGSLWSWYQEHGLTDRMQLLDPYVNFQQALILFNTYPNSWGRHRCGR